MKFYQIGCNQLAILLLLGLGIFTSCEPALALPTETQIQATNTLQPSSTASYTPRPTFTRTWTPTLTLTYTSTATITTTPTITETETATITPTLHPVYNDPGDYYYDMTRCARITFWVDVNEQEWYKQMCVKRVVVLEDRTMQFFVQWKSHFGWPIYHKQSDENNPNIYITDNNGVHYSMIEAGGDAVGAHDLRYDQALEGWFRFGPPEEGAIVLTFHGYDQGYEFVISDIRLIQFR
jgi:hypothetical protein